MACKSPLAFAHEEPLPEPFTFDDLMAEAGLKRRVVPMEPNP